MIPMVSTKERGLETNYGVNELKYLELLAEKFPTVQAAKGYVKKLRMYLLLSYC